MISATVRVVLGIGVTVMVAFAAIVLGNDRYDDDAGAVAKACSGAATTPQLENALFNARARSDGGSDPICSPAGNDDDFGAALSRRVLTRR